MDIKGVLLQWLIFFDKKSPEHLRTGTKNQQLTVELHKPCIRIFKKRVFIF